MSIINASYKILSDPEKRQQHDAWIAGMEQYEKTAAAIQNSSGPGSSQKAKGQSSLHKSPAYKTEYEKAASAFRQYSYGAESSRTETSQPSPPKAKPTGRQSLRDSKILTHLRKYWFFYFLLALILIAYIATSKDEEETSYKPPVKYTQAKPKYSRPFFAENGSPWPQASGYIKGYPHRFADGRSQVTVDNSNTNSDMFVKLFNLDETKATAVRVFFIKAGDQYTVKNITQGNYDIRYKNLNTGHCFRSEPFLLQEFPEADGVRYSTIRMTLYKALQGNMKTRNIVEEDFSDVKP